MKLPPLVVCAIARATSIVAASAALLPAVLPVAIQAQPVATGSITGRIQNKATGEYLRNAVVTVAGTNLSTTAGDGGFYRLTGVPAGEVTLEVNYAGLDAAQAAVVVAAGAPVAQDFALTSKAYDGEVIALEEFVVATSREGNAKAIMEQRIAPNFKKVISSDAMGNVSEGNVGEFLKLMPGVMMDYVEADTRAMRVRGLQPKYATVLLDGMQPASAGSSNIGTGRAFEFEQLSIDSVETVELTKSPTADLPSSVSGVVNLRTKSAFDHAGRRINWSASLSANSYYLDLGATEGWDDESHSKILPNARFEFSDVYLDGRLGVMFGAAHHHTMAAQKHIWFFYNNSDADLTNNDTEFPTINRIWYQDGPKPTQRENAYLRLDYKFSDQLTAYVRFDFTDYDAKFYNRSLSFYPATYTAYTPTAITVSNGRASAHSNQYMQKKGETVLLNAATTYDTGDFAVEASVHYSRASNWYENLSLGHFTDFSTTLPNLSWTIARPDRGSTALTFTQVTGPNWRDLSNYRFEANSIGWHERRARDDRATAKLDFTHDFTVAGTPTTLKWGGLANKQWLDVKRYGLMQTSFVGADGIAGTTDDNPITMREDNFANDWGAGGNVNAWPLPSPWKLASRYASNPSHFVDNSLQHLQQRLQNNWLFEEDIRSAYAAFDLKFGKLQLLPGVRFEYTNSDGTGTRVLTDTQAAAASGSPAGTPAFVAAKYSGRISGGNSYDALLKYFQVKYDLTPDLALRFSYHDAITRADIANLVPGIAGVDFDNQRLTASNPDLKEEMSENFNLSLEYYFEPVGVFSVAIFESRVQDRQASSIGRLGADGYEGDTAYANWELVSQFNVGNTIKLRGVEFDYSQQLSFLPGAFSGLGVFANYTHLQYDEWAFYLGSPLWTGNGGVSYAIGKFSSRLNANWVGKLLQNPGRTYNLTTGEWTVSAPFAPEFQADRLAFDVNFEYEINRTVTVFLDGRNIFNEPSTHTYRGTNEDNFMRILKTGSIWLLGVKGRF